MVFVVEETFKHGVFNGYNFVFRTLSKKPPILVDETDVEEVPTWCCVESNDSGGHRTRRGRYAHSLKTNGWYCEEHLEERLRKYEYSEPDAGEQCSDSHSYIGECPICYENIRCGNECVVTSCDHMFHYRCLAKWCSTRDTCPMCRSGLSYAEMNHVLRRMRFDNLTLNFNRVVLGQVLKKSFCCFSDLTITDDIVKTERIIKALKKIDQKVLQELYDRVIQHMNY
jgi:hypothetical protein